GCVSRLFFMYCLLLDVVDPLFIFFFSSRRRHTRCYRDWSSDVCSSDLALPAGAAADRLVGVVWQEQPGRASGGERGGTRRARCGAARECGLQHLMVTRMDADEEPGRDRKSVV